MHFYGVMYASVIEKIKMEDCSLVQRSVGRLPNSLHPVCGFLFFVFFSGCDGC